MILLDFRLSSSLNKIEYDEVQQVKWIGITGSIGTGKSTVSQIIREMGFEVLDADKIAQEQLRKNSAAYPQIVKLFGQDILSAEQEIDRKKLSQKVFGNKENLARLEEIIHPLVQSEVEASKKIFKSRGDKAAFYDVPLLFEKKLQGRFDAVLLVACDPAIQIERIKKRSSWSDEEIVKRLKSQMTLADKIKLSSYILYNNSDLVSLKKNTKEMLNKLLKTP